MRTLKFEGYKDAGHDKEFKPAKDIQRKVKADFQHMTDHVEKKKCRKGEDGAVIIEPRNFLTNPPKKGEVGKGTTFSGILPHLPDPFDRRRELLKKEREEHESKLQEKAFSQRVRKRDHFNSLKDVYGEDVPLPPKKLREQTPPPQIHDKPFKPSHPPKRGYNKTLEKFP